MLEKTLAKILLDLGIPPQYTGFNYIVDIVAYCLKNDVMPVHGKMNGSIYPMVAEKYGIDKRCIERCIRQAIQVCWDTNKITKIREVLGPSANYKKMSSLEFLATMVYKIKLS